MRTWTIEGADGTTGADRVLSIEAPTHEDAEREARQQGLLVSEIHESTASGALQAAADAAQAVRKKRPETVSYATIEQSRKQRRSVVPSYSGLQIGSVIVGAFAIIYYMGAVVGIGLALWAVIQRDTPFQGLAAFSLFIYAAVMGMIGGLLHAASAGCVALRDIARNSFNR